MTSKFSEYSAEEQKMLNGQAVMSALSNLGNAATSDRISDEIGYFTNQSKSAIEPEVKRILRRGISNGFLEKFGKNYLLSGEHTIVEVDSKRRSYKSIGKRDKRKRSMKSVDNTTDRREDDYLRFSRNLSFKPIDVDSNETDDKLVLLNPREVVNGIINDLYKLVSPTEQTSDEQEEDENVIDLKAVLSKNLSSMSIPFDYVSAVE